MFQLLRQLVKFIRVYRKFWLVPLLIGVLALGGVLVIAEGSAIAPLIYALF